MDGDVYYDEEYDPDWEMPELTPEQRDAIPPSVVAYVNLPDGTVAEMTVDGWGRVHSSDPRVRVG